jgi:deazaflavin-dependent oxidoreductase (nitroreductase family)
MHDGALYVLAGGRGDWLRNLEANPAVTVRIGSQDAPELAARARVVTDPAEHDAVQRVMDAKYPGYPNWIRDATPVAIERLEEA